MSKVRKRKRRPGLVARYFLRRLAETLRGGRLRPSLAYTQALASTMALFVLMPGIALFSLAAWAGLRLDPALLSSTNGHSSLAGVLLITFSLVLAGHLWFGQRLRRFRYDFGAADAFDTDKDREIAFWQKVIVTAICGFAAPLCALAMVANP